MCNCEELSLPTGNTGSQGLYGGYSTDFLFSSTLTASPSSGTLRFNSATYNLVSSIYVSDTNNDSIDIDLVLDTFTGGYIRIFKKDDNTKFWYGLITANTDSGSYHTLTVTYILSNGTFSADDNIVVTYVKNGTDGAAGSNGTDGTNYPVVLSNDISDSGLSSSTSEQILKSYTLPAGTLTTNGDICEITAVFQITIDGYTKKPGLYFGAKELIGNNTAISAASPVVSFYESGVTANSRIVVIKAEVSRTAAATQFAVVNSSRTMTIEGSNVLLNTASTPAETLSGTILIKATASSSTGSLNNVICKQLTVKYLKL